MKKYLFSLFVIMSIFIFTACKNGQVQSGGVIENTSIPTSTQTPTITKTSIPTGTFLPTQTKTVEFISPFVTPSTPVPTAQVSYLDQVEYWQDEPLGREYYLPLDQAAENFYERLMRNFTEAYSRGLENGESWVFDPILLGMRFAGYPNIDYLYPDHVYVYFQHDGRVIVVVVDNFLMDDSVKDQETRIDLVMDENRVWKIEWAGSRFKCHSYRTIDDYDGWRTSLCP